MSNNTNACSTAYPFLTCDYSTQQCNENFLKTRLQNFSKSFWLGGFEAASHINGQGGRVDMLASTKHDLYVHKDYLALKEVGISGCRDTARWHLIDQHGTLDFSSLKPFIDAANSQEIEVLWTLCHYGWPDDVDIFSPEFVERFASYAPAVVNYLADQLKVPPLISLFNEISFMAYAIGKAGLMYPFAPGRQPEAKRQLIRASVAASKEILRTNPEVVLVHIDPVYRVVAPADRPDWKIPAAQQEAAQYESFDLLVGRLEPELGGEPRFVSMVGLNYYFVNQWEYPNFIALKWDGPYRDERWQPFDMILDTAYSHYQRPLFIAETGHFGSGRAEWLGNISNELLTARLNGLPIVGACLYPIIDRHDWENWNHWHRAGLWDICEEDRELPRILCRDYAFELKRAQLAHSLFQQGVRVSFI